VVQVSNMQKCIHNIQVFPKMLRDASKSASKLWEGQACGQLEETKLMCWWEKKAGRMLGLKKHWTRKRLEQTLLMWAKALLEVKRSWLEQQGPHSFVECAAVAELLVTKLALECFQTVGA